MGKIKDIALLVITLVALVLLVLMLPKCDGFKLPNLKPNNDTIRIHTVDTLWAKDTLFKFKTIKIPVPTIVTDTLYKPIYIDSNRCNTVFVYADSLVDSNLVIYYKDYIQGILRNKDLSYKLKVPLRIYDSVTTTIIKRPTVAVYGALTLGQGIIAPGAEVGLKRFKIGLGINLITNKPIFSIGYKLFER